MPYRPFGDAPVDLAQEVRASPPSPSQANLPPPGASAQQLARKMPVRGAPRMPPRVVNRGTFQTVPVAAILQGGGMNGAPIQATNINGAPVAVDPLDRAGSLGNINVDTSVSGQVRAAKALGALIDSGVPVSGNYTDAIRNAAGFAFGPKRLPKQGFAAASYSYPARQMVVGATLSGTPIVAMMPTNASPRAAAPRLATKGGIRGQISSSPSEDRRRLISTLMGLGAANMSFVNDSVGDTAEDKWVVTLAFFFDELPSQVPGVAQDAARSAIKTVDYTNRFDFVKKIIVRNIGRREIDLGVKTITLPTWLREAFIKWTYKKMWGKDIDARRLAMAQGIGFNSAPSIAAVLSNPEYDPAAQAPSSGGAITPPTSGTGVGPGASVPSTSVTSAIQQTTKASGPVGVPKAPTNLPALNRFNTQLPALAVKPTLPPIVVAPPALPSLPKMPPAAPAAGGGLSTGAMAGIAVAALVGGFFVVKALRK